MGSEKKLNTHPIPPQGAYHLIFKDNHGTLTHDGYSGAHAYSLDGIHFTVTTPALAYGTTHRWSDGQVRTMSRQERAEIFRDATGAPLAAFFATDTELDGPANRTWNMVIPLRPAEV